MPADGSASPTPKAPSPRISSLDQFRGYTVVGMFLVNYLSGFTTAPAVLGHHNTYCSYADTIMPQFFFAVGFAFRLTFGRRAVERGMASAYLRAARRFFSLALVAILFYSYLDGSGLWNKLSGDQFWSGLQEAAKRTWFQTLMHIAVTSLWILPVIRASASVRIMYMVLSACAHVFLSYHFNLTWINSPPGAIDGGPLGFLTWSIPTLVGTLACDVIMRPTIPNAKIANLLLWSGAIMLLGYGFSCGTRLYDVSRLNGASTGSAPNMVWPPLEHLGEGNFSSYLAEPPFVGPPDSKVRLGNYWMMSQRYCSVSYQTFAAGFSLLIYALFFIACDLCGWQVGAFRTLGRNALTSYIVASLIQRWIKRPIMKHFNNDASIWYVAGGFLLLLLAVWAIMRILEWRRIYLRV
jgi:predicted acyltransferase